MPAVIFSFVSVTSASSCVCFVFASSCVCSVISSSRTSKYSSVSLSSGSISSSDKSIFWLSFSRNSFIFSNNSTFSSINFVLFFLSSLNSSNLTRFPSSFHSWSIFLVMLWLSFFSVSICIAS